MSDSKYTYYNKGKKYEFDLDELTVEELEKFEKMTEKQRLRFITSFDIKKQGFQDSLSIKSTKTENEQKLPKYNELQKYTNKLKEVESIMKDIKDRHDDYEWKDIDKISILDDDGLIDDSFKELFNSINKDDIATVKKDADVDEVSLGMLRRYFKKQADKYSLNQSKNIFEILKSLFDQSKILIHPDKNLGDKEQLDEEIDILRERLSKWKRRDVRLNEELSDEEIDLMKNYIRGNDEFKIIETNDLSELKNKTLNGLKIFESKYTSFNTGLSMKKLIGKELYEQYKNDLNYAKKNGTKEDQYELAEIIAEEIIEMPEIPRIVKDKLRQAMVKNEVSDSESETNTVQSDTQTIKPSDSNPESKSEFKFITQSEEEDFEPITADSINSKEFPTKEVEGRTNKVKDSDEGNIKKKVNDETVNVIGEIVDSIPELGKSKEKQRKLQKLKERIGSKIRESLIELDLPEIITRELSSLPEFENAKEGSERTGIIKDKIRNKIKESLLIEIDLPEIITKEVNSIPELKNEKGRVLSILMRKVKDPNQKISDSLPEAEDFEDIPEIDLKKERMKIQKDPKILNIEMPKDLDENDIKILAEKIRDDILERINEIGAYITDTNEDDLDKEFNFTYKLPNKIKLNVDVWDVDYLGPNCNFAFNYNDEYVVLYENKKFTITNEKPNVKIESLPDSDEEKEESEEFTDFKSLTPEEIEFINTIFKIDGGKANMSYMKQINGMMVSYYIGNNRTIDSIEFQNDKYSFVFKNKVVELTNKQTNKTIKFMLRNYVNYVKSITPQNNYNPPEVFNIPLAQGSAYDLNEADKWIISMILHIYNRILDIKVQNPNNYKNYDTRSFNGVVYKYKLGDNGRWDIVGSWENGSRENGSRENGSREKYRFQNDFENGHEVITIETTNKPRRVIKYYIELGQATKEDFKRRVARGIAVYKYYDDSGNSHKIKSGSIISKIKDAFEGKIEKSKAIRELKAKLSDVETMKREIKDLRNEIENLKNKPIPKPLPPAALKPIPKPVAPQIPSKPQLRHVELEEEKKGIEDSDDSIESQLRRTMANRRKDIEYSDSDDSDSETDWGAGLRKISAKEFIANLKAKPSDVSTMKSGRLY